jgi:cytosine deaminase
MVSETPLRPVSLLNARVPAGLAEGLSLRDHDSATGLAFTDFSINDQGLIGTGSEGSAIDLGGRIVLPCFIDSHVHLDKAFIVGRTGLPEAGLLDAVKLSMADAPKRTEADLAERMEKGLRLAYSHGTAAIRTHLDTPGMPADSAAWKVFNELRQRWENRINLQAVALMALERVENDDFVERCRQIADFRGVLGAFVPPGGGTSAYLDQLFAHAADFGLEVDFHVDETLDRAANGLELIAESVLRTGFKGRVVAGHCCSLSSRDENEAAALITKAAASGIHVISLPHSNLYLQDRHAHRTPRMRGLTLAHELRAAGVPVHFASDNVQDPFFPFGEFDMLEVTRSAVRLAHLDNDIASWIPQLFRNAAAATGFGDHGHIRPGGRGDFIVFDARNWYDLLSHAHTDRMVFRNGAALPATKADLRELFALEIS